MRKIGLKIFTLAMLVFTCITPFIKLQGEIPSFDITLFRIQALSFFAILFIGGFLRWKPFGLKNRVKMFSKTNIKSTLIYWVVLLVIAISPIVFTNSLHTPEYRQYQMQQQEEKERQKEELENTNNGKPVDTIEPSTTTVEPTQEPDVPDTIIDTYEPPESSGKPSINIDDKPTTTNTPDSSILIEEPTDTEEYIGKEGVMYDINQTFDLNGISYTINKIKIKTDLKTISSPYNFYMIFIDYSITNNSSKSITWNAAYNGNLYGLFKVRGFERNLGGNSTVKDDDFIKSDTHKRTNTSTIEPDNSLNGFFSVIVKREVEDPEDGLMLKANETLNLDLHFVCNNTDNIIAIQIN